MNFKITVECLSFNSTHFIVLLLPEEATIISCKISEFIDLH